MIQKNSDTAEILESFHAMYYTKECFNRGLSVYLEQIEDKKKEKVNDLVDYVEEFIFLSGEKHSLAQITILCEAIMKKNNWELKDKFEVVLFLYFLYQKEGNYSH